VLTGGTAAALVAVAAGVWAGTDAFPSPRPAAPAAAPPAPPGPAAAAASPAAADRAQLPADAQGWREVVAELYRRRAAAFTTASAAPLAGVYADGSPLLTADQRSVAALAATGEVLRGFTPGVPAVTAVAATPGRAELRLVDSRPAYDVVAADGRARTGREVVVSHAAPRADAAVRMVLVATPVGWRIESAELVD
jgi:hypothetical protein